MKNFSGLILGVAIFAAALAFSPSPVIGAAHAQTTGVALANTDGGAHYVATVGKGQHAALQCREPACFRLLPSTGAATTVAANCATDAQVEGFRVSGAGSAVTQPFRGQRVEFQTGGLTRVVAFTPDAGDPGCTSYLLPKNN